MGISFAKLFGVKDYRGRRLLGIFGSNLELRSKAYSIAKNTSTISEDIFFSSYEKQIFSSNLDKLDFNNLKKTHKYRLIFVMMYILPWIDSYKRFPTIDDFGTLSSQIGIDYEKIFEIRINEDRVYTPLFNSLKDLKDFIELQIQHQEINATYYKYLHSCSDIFSK